ncbi:hypothetical protein KBZ21_05385 [Streptomyces sp. A73]|uniref:DUF6571 family protein n=1 Tax=Streptomyces sp. RK75 TaxID=2824895 RepID=UPI000C18FA6D|nr:DUF6571 family protein [Streptomyces sp. RK75]MBQ0864516.1 hypothetical protein [Streptomyces sp. RK75]MBQ1157602.1 hypothetical protein [Streptomyces sp. A73]
MTKTLDYQTVRHVNLTALRAAVKAWDKLPKEFEEVHTSFDRTVAKPLSTERSGWHGESHKAAVKHFSAVQKQVVEAAGQAEWLGKEMSRCLKIIEDAKKALKDVEDVVYEKPTAGAKNYLKLNKKDGVVYVDPPKDESPGITKAYRETLADLNSRILKALREAAEADEDLKKALNFDPYGKGFNSDTPQVQAKKDVDALYKLAGDEDFKRDPKLLSKVNGILAKNDGNTYFAEEFATRKGAKGVLELWYKAAQPDYEDTMPPDPKDRPKGVDKQLAALQDNLGNTLALASHSDSPAMTKWKQDVIDLGYQRMGDQPPNAAMGTYRAAPPYGFQVMSNLMRTGKWDTGFLNDYGAELKKVDEKPFMTPGPYSHEEKAVPERKWLSYGLNPPNYLNFGAEYDQGKDPFTGYMEALGHNAEASTDFFSDKENLDYVLRDRKWFPDGEIPDSGEHKGWQGGHVATGHALGAATTGHAWDAPLHVPAEHTSAQANLMSELIKGMGEMDENGNAEMPMHPGMRHGLGNAAAEYAPDFFQAMKDGSDADKLFPMSGEPADIDHRDATKFLVQLGQDPDAHAAVTAGQKLYTAQVLDHHLGGDVPADQKYNAPTENLVHEVLKTSGETAGTLAAGAQEAIIGPAVVEDQQYDKGTLSKRLWTNGAFGTVVTGASVLKPFAAHPVGAATAAALIIGAEGAALNDHDAEHWSSNKSAPAADRAGAIYDEMAGRDVRQNEKMLEAIGKEYDIDVSKSWSELYSEDGFTHGYSRVASTAPFLTSIEQVKQMAIAK